MTCHQPTRDYVARRRAEGKSTRFTTRCLKRYVAREIYRHLTDPQPVATTDDLQFRRHELGLSLAAVADALDTQPARISELERGTRRPPELEQRYRTWLADQAA